ncbi:AEC family transporter [Cesiribacter andamanensis]|uniref:Auxin efflux carrier n=1 Tax=Cesiribacter andamanensis AMV16 TaxID=1279009 RepID=M7P191_9BACT|nr:AEC family transporter [Cesiribacter andamanensis]EMR04364.1 auxin efflux carrier [Cesiribacter andamanensis AMV16]
MLSLLIIPLCLGGGLLLQRLAPPAWLPRLLSLAVINVALPALILEKIPILQLQEEHLLPVLMPWLVFSVGWLGFSYLGRRAGWERTTKGGIILTCSLGNTSFVGIPVMHALWGAAGVEVAILADQPGSFAALSTVGIAAASWYAGGRVSVGAIAARMAKFPPFIAFVLAVVLNMAAWAPQGLLLQGLHYGGLLVVPFSLLAVGLQVELRGLFRPRREILMGLGYKLLLAPLMIFVLYMLLLQQRGLMAMGSVLEAAMGPMVTATLIAERFGLNPPLVRQVLSLGILLSFFTLVFWYWLVQSMG